MKKRICFNLKSSTIDLIKKYATIDEVSISQLVEETILFRLKYRQFKELKNDSDINSFDWFNDFWESAKKEKTV